MSCDRFRERLMAGGVAGLEPGLARHPDDCAPCAEFARRLELAHGALREHRTEHLPDPYFAQRVSALAAGDSDQLGWAAVRLLPVALALTLVLTAWAWLTTPGPSALVERAPSEDPIEWALQENGS